jgi:HAD superfamily hydrolase (TIGR01493 family)
VAIRGVLFDFSSTLFRLEPDVSWLHGLTGPDGVELDGREQAALIAEMTLGPSRHLPADLKDEWERRDLEPDTHRKVYLAAYKGAGMDVGPGVTERVYDSMLLPESWKPYPDTEAALRAVKDAGLGLGVLSNIAWEIQPTFAHYGWLDLPDTYVLSYQEGLVKPDPRIFELACARIGADPADTLMVGDSDEADGAAVRLGCRFARVAPVSPAERPDSLVNALRAFGVIA